MSAFTVSSLVGSSLYEAVADDALKDEDNAAWVMTLDPTVRDAWIERIQWIRLVDRLAENELVSPGNSGFSQFYRAWQQLLATGNLEQGCPHFNLLATLASRWCKAPLNPDNQLAIRSWNQYLEVIAHYHRQNFTIAHFEQYEAMLTDLGGSCFQVLPFLSSTDWVAAGYVGKLDQFYNNLRDMAEDARQGICYLPTALLDQFGVQQEEILQLQAPKNPGYRPMMQVWLDGYLQMLRRQVMPLIQTAPHHPSWQILRDWSLHRYQRIERVFRACDFDYTQFPQDYWAEVKQELPGLLAQVRQVQAQTSISTRALQLQA